MSGREPKADHKSSAPSEKPDAEPPSVASLDPACAGKPAIVVRRAGEDDAGADDRQRSRGQVWMTSIFDTGTKRHSAG